MALHPLLRLCLCVQPPAWGNCTGVDGIAIAVLDAGHGSGIDWLAMPLLLMLLLLI